MPVDPADIACWQRIDARTTTSGRLEPGDIVRLSAIGVRHVINLALADSPGALAEEAELLAAAGLRYSHIPVPFDAPDDRHFAAFCAAFEADDAPVHIHCIMNWRVSAFLYRYHRQRCGMPQAQAQALMERQWSPASSTNAAAPAWAAFIGWGED